MTDHERWEDAAGSYVLGALTDDEHGGYEAHLKACPICRAEVDELRVAAEALPVSPLPMSPSPALKLRIMAEVEREAELLASAGQPDRAAAPAPREKRRWFGSGFAFPRAAMGALACVMLLIGLGVGGLVFGGSSGNSRTVAFNTTPALAQTSAQLDVSGNGATLVANNLPTPPAGKTYMVWLSRPGHAPEPTSALFTPRRDGSATASVTGDLEGVDAVLVNVEPVGGSTTPTSDVLMTAKLS
jgi:anti-sigma-K factor RskA